MFYELILTSKFKKNLKLARKRGLNLDLLNDVVEKLQNDIQLDEKHRDHQLNGQLKNFRECHIQPDWLLIYMKKNDVLTLTLIDTGKHSDLYDE